MKNTQLRRALALLLAAASIGTAATLAACNGDGGGEQIGPALGEEHADEYLDNVLPTDTYNGAKLGLIGREATEIKPNDEENGQPVDDALLRRNAKTEERYDVDLEYYITIGSAEAAEKVNTAVLANESLYDVFFGNLSAAAPYMLNNSLILSTDNFPHLNLSQTWWVADCTDQLSIHNKSFFITGMIAYEHTVDATCIIFNKVLSGNKGLENHFDLVRSKQWTIDKMFENMKAIAHDDNGDTLMDGNDTWGLIYSSADAFIFSHGSNIEFMLYDDADEPYYVDDYTTIVAKAEKLNSILDNQKYTANTNLLEDQGISLSDDSVFASGKSLYTTSTVQGGISLRERDFYDFGILVPPMYDENQADYKSWATAWTGGVLMFPTTNQQETMTSVIIEAMAYQSSLDGGYYYALLNKYIKGRGAYDFDSEEMIDLCLHNKTYDVDLVFNLGISSLIRNAVSGDYGDEQEIGLATSIAGKVRASSRSLRGLIRSWDSVE